ncbi:MAG: PD-(D/E)XK nuclease family protein [Pseudomonadota bacterium]
MTARPYTAAVIDIETPTPPTRGPITPFVELPAGWPDGETLLVTASERLRKEYRYAAHYRARFADAEAGRPPSSWPQPRVVSWSGLLDHFYQQAARAGRLNRALASPAEWRTLLRRAAPENTERFASLFEEAWRDVHEWQLDVDAPEWSLTDNTSTCRAWLRNTQAALAQAGLLSPAELASCEEILPEPRSPALEPKLLLVGFERVSAAQQRCIDRLRARGAQIEVLPTPTPERPRPGQVAPFASAADELAAACTWAAQRLRTHPGPELPRIGIVVGDLMQRYGEMRRLLRSHLDPGGQRAEGLYNLGGGMPLASHPLVASALSFLGALTQPQHYRTIEALLSDAHLPLINRRGRRFELHPEVLTLGELRPDWQTPALSDINRRVRGFGSDERPATLWWRIAAELLRLAGWDQARDDSAGFQAARQFLELLQTGAGSQLARVGWSAALAELRYNAGAALFAEAGRPAPVQVLGSLEANGLEFDNLWLTGMGAVDWPAAVSTNPLLPRELLQRHRVPRTSPESEFRFAEIWLARRSASAANVIASFATDEDVEPTDAGGLVGGASALLAGWPLAPAEIAGDDSLAHPLSLNLRASAIATEAFEDVTTAPPPAGDLKGGAGLLDALMRCPLRAWLNYQLALAPLEPPHTFPDARERGNALHKALDALLQTFPSSTALHSAAPEAREQACADSAAAAVTIDDYQRFPQAIRRSEVLRLTRLLRRFVAEELKRDRFDVVAREAHTELSLGDRYRIRLRLDRVDRVEDDHELVIDYKSGRKVSYAWDDDTRLDVPQVAGYLQARPAARSGAYVHVHAEGISYSAVADDALASALRGANTQQPWQDRKDRWARQIEKLGAQLASGDATARPSHTRACVYCDYKPVCRIDLGTEVDEDGALDDV